MGLFGMRKPTHPRAASSRASVRKPDRGLSKHQSPPSLKRISLVPQSCGKSSSMSRGIRNTRTRLGGGAGLRRFQGLMQVNLDKSGRGMTDTASWTREDATRASRQGHRSSARSGTWGPARSGSNWTYNNPYGDGIRECSRRPNARPAGSLAKDSLAFSSGDASASAVSMVGRQKSPSRTKGRGAASALTTDSAIQTSSSIVPRPRGRKIQAFASRASS